MSNSDEDVSDVRSNTSDICDKISHIELKYMKIMIELRKYRKTKALINNTL